MFSVVSFSQGPPGPPGPPGAAGTILRLNGVSLHLWLFISLNCHSRNDDDDDEDEDKDEEDKDADDYQPTLYNYLQACFTDIMLIIASP